MGLVPPASSCRAGAPVRMLRSSGAVLPSTIKVFTNEDAEGGLQHIVHVSATRWGLAAVAPGSCHPAAAPWTSKGIYL